MSALKADLLERAAQLVETNGLIKEQGYVDDEDPDKPAVQCRVCLFGAAFVAVTEYLHGPDVPAHLVSHSGGLLNDIEDVIRNGYYRLRPSGWNDTIQMAPISWSDAPERTAQDVAKLLRDLAAEQREEELQPTG